MTNAPCMPQPTTDRESHQSETPFDEMRPELRSSVPDVPFGFVVADAGSANWVVRKIAQARAYAARVEAWAAAELRRAQNEERFFLARYGLQLETWARAELARNKSRSKSLPLPAGTVGFRTERGKLMVSSEEQLAAWCRRSLPEAVHVSVKTEGLDAVRLTEWVKVNCPAAQVQERVMRNDVSERVMASGELPDGAQWSNGGEKFYVK